MAVRRLQQPVGMIRDMVEKQAADEGYVAMIGKRRLVVVMICRIRPGMRMRGMEVCGIPVLVGQFMAEGNAETEWRGVIGDGRQSGQDQ